MSVNKLKRNILFNSMLSICLFTFSNCSSDTDHDIEIQADDELAAEIEMPILESEQQQTPRSYSLDSTIELESELNELEVPPTNEAVAFSKQHNKIDLAQEHLSKRDEKQAHLETTTHRASTAYYVIQPSDTLSQISEKILGSHKKWQTLAKHNKISNPNKIIPGEVIQYQLPSDQVQHIEKISKLTYKVTSGDTLASISKKIYGKSTYWKAILKWNKNSIKNRNLIFPNQKLTYYPKDKLLSSRHIFYENKLINTH